MLIRCIMPMVHAERLQFIALDRYDCVLTEVAANGSACNAILRPVAMLLALRITRVQHADVQPTVPRIVTRLTTPPRHPLIGRFDPTRAQPIPALPLSDFQPSDFQMIGIELPLLTPPS
jgi:hypothetical protein